ncbi:MAG: DUF465 domain-containing protein [Rickettsiales bacterium]
MSLSTHIESLQAKHRLLEQELAQEMQHAAYDFQRINMIKKEKLRIKEELSSLIRDQGRSYDKTAS